MASIAQRTLSMLDVGGGTAISSPTPTTAPSNRGRANRGRTDPGRGDRGKANGGRDAANSLLPVMHVHNAYQQLGGEDRSTQAEVDMFRNRGHQVAYFKVSNDQVDRMSPLQLAASTLWNRSSYAQLRRAIRSTGAKVIHFHNTLPIISPSAYYAAKAEGVAVVQTLHNYRPHCINGLFLRDGKVCTVCAGKRLPLAGIKHKCYRGNLIASLGVTATQTIHGAAGTWARNVDAFIAISGFAKDRFVGLGMPAWRVFHKPQPIVPDLGPVPSTRSYGLFVGRLAPEKGVETLLKAATRLKANQRLVLVGEGPLLGRVREVAAQHPNVECWGGQSPERVMELMGEARFVVMPSEWFETFGRVAVEAFSRATPVIATKIGAVAELVDEGKSGMYVEPGRPEALASVMAWAFEHPTEMAEMGRYARHVFDQRYAEDKNYANLLSIYEWALENPAGTKFEGRR